MWIYNFLAHAADAGSNSRQILVIHPILVNFTAALVPTSVAADVLGRVFRRESLRSTGWWTLFLAAAITPLTGITGWLWMRSMEDMDHWQMPYHKWLGLSLALALLLLAAWRAWFYRRDKWPSVPYLVVALMTFQLVVFQGELGGSMTFGHTLMFPDDDEHGGHAAIQTKSAAVPRPGQTSERHHEHVVDPTTSNEWKDHLDLDPISTKP